jgi:hypothetical protein
MPSPRSVVLTILVLVPLVATPLPEYTDWSAPVNLGPVVNSTFNDLGPATSKDGRTLFFGSDRPGGSGGLDLWVSQRPSRDAEWGPPINLGPVVNSGVIDNVPALSRDEHWLFFNSNRTGGLGGNDIWATYREHTKDDLGWGPPINLGPGVNTAAQDQGASFLENGGSPLLFFNSDRPGGVGLTDIWVSELLPSGEFGAARLVPELSSPFVDQRPSMRFDGLEVVFFSNRPGSIGNVDLWTATRPTPLDAWSTPVDLGTVVNSTAANQNPYLDPDRESLYFASNRAGTVGGLDLYVSSRTRTRR